MTARSGTTRRTLWATVGAVALLTACSTAPPSYKTVLTGEKEVPPVNTAASGLSDISVRTGRCPSAASASECNMLVGTVQTTGIVSTAAHIHQGKAGENGPVIIPLVKTTNDVWTVPLGTALTQAQYEAFLAGNLYVNVHSDAYKAGEIRAQLKP